MTSKLPGWTDALTNVEQGALKKRRFPDWVPPMLAVLSKDVFSDPSWIFEPKLDGQRSLVFKKASRLRLMTRNQKDRTSHYPELLSAFEKQEIPDLIADGEIVAFEGERTSFSRLQDRMGNSRPTEVHLRETPVFFYLFDLIWFDGYDLTQLGLAKRKALLEESVRFKGPVRFSAHLEEDGETAYRAACDKGWEGLIAKRADSPYTHGRSKDWLKMKCVLEQEFVIVGWTDPQGSRTGLGALLVGYHSEGELLYAGKVGTGFNSKELARLSRALSRIGRTTPPVKMEKGFPRKGAHWVTPRLVAQIGFSEWTTDGRLRHPRYIGLRDDKDSSDVVRETG